MVQPDDLNSLMTSKTFELWYDETAHTGVDAITAGTPNSFSASDDERFISMLGVEFEINQPRKRTNFGTERVYTYDAPDITLTFRLSAGDDLVNLFNTLSNHQSTTNEPPAYTWIVRGTTTDGVTEVYRFKGKVHNYRLTKEDEEQAEYSTIQVSITILDRVVTIT